jgi:acyl-CoA reductase-like NAD-dependent aldehyde dehydrogenase
MAQAATLASSTIKVFNPTTEELIAEVADSDQAAVHRAVARARALAADQSEIDFHGTLTS